MTTSDLKGKFYPTAVGSLPYRDSKPACEIILRNFKEVPFWPQLVKRTFLENMYVQFSQGLPGAVVDLNEKRIYVDTAKDISGEMERLYAGFLENDLDFFAIGRDYAEGLYAMIDAVKGAGAKPAFLKGQITGPISFGLTVTDEKKRPLFYNPELKEALIKLLAMKAKWQARKLKETGLERIVFIDEPYLASAGSSFISLKKEEAQSALNEVGRAIRGQGALCGIHCCGNTDWGFVLENTEIDILSFDAYNFYETISLYPEELGSFLERGGLLAWGIVPNTEEVLKENCDSLTARLETAFGLLSKKGIKKEDLLDSMLITPSCGLGLADEGLSGVVMERAIEVSDGIRLKYKAG